MNMFVVLSVRLAELEFCQRIVLRTNILIPFSLTAFLEILATKIFKS